MKKIYLLLLFIISNLNVVGQDEFEVYTSDFAKCETDSERFWECYTYSVVKDSILMNQIVEKIDEILDNDSLKNLIREEYFLPGK